MGQSARRVIQSKDLKRFVEVDGLHKALVSIDSHHKKVHDGEIHQFSSTLDISSGGSMNIFIVTGSKNVHARFRGCVERITTTRLFEDPTTGGSPSSVGINQNRTSSVPSPKVRFSAGVAVLTTGTLLSVNVLNANDGDTQLFGSEEWILKPNTNYLFRIFNVASAAAQATGLVEFYEVIP